MSPTGFAPCRIIIPIKRFGNKQHSWMIGMMKKKGIGIWIGSSGLASIRRLLIFHDDGNNEKKAKRKVEYHSLLWYHVKIRKECFPWIEFWIRRQTELYTRNSYNHAKLFYNHAEPFYNHAELFCNHVEPFYNHAEISGWAILQSCWDLLQSACMSFSTYHRF